MESMEIDKEQVKSWAASRKVSAATVDEIINLGFTSLEAVELLTAEDLKKSKISIGQQKLLLKAVSSLAPVAEVTREDTAGTGTARAATPSNVPSGDDTQGNAAVHPAGEEAFRQSLLNQLQALPGGPPARAQGGCIPATAGSSTVTGMYSWQDPQVFLKSVSNSKTQCHNIVDFVSQDCVNEERLLSSGDDIEIICRAGSRKPKLENLTISQWSQANIAILYRLFQDGDIDLPNVFDYLSYTAHIYNLISSHEVLSVFYYDREYRRLQAAHKFRWGMSVSHLAPGFLRLRAPTQQGGGQKLRATQRPDRHTQRPNSAYQSHSASGRPICKSFNIRAGCTFRNCRFDHVCNIPGCGKDHPGHSHPQESKNLNAL
jgi:hypothetical protein